MTDRRLEIAAAVTAAAGFTTLTVAFVIGAASFRSALLDWSARDLEARAELAARILAEPLATQDFAALRAFGARCAEDGLDVTVTAPGGGTVFTTHAANGRDARHTATQTCGEARVTLSRPASHVLAPLRRAQTVFALAFLTGVSGMLFVFFALYRQRARLKELVRAEAFRAAFVADVSHEIKTPLAGILGCVDLLADAPRRGALPPEAQERLFGALRSEARRLNALAQDIVSLARVDAATREETRCRAPVDLAEVVRETLARLAPEATAAGVALKTEGCGPLVVSGDAELLARVIENLVRNALRHSGSPEVTVRLEARGLAVEDHGIGIPPEHREKIFTRFYRVDPSRSDATGGSGLGLAIVRAIARLHGGDVTCEPVAPHGARFNVRLPPVGARREKSNVV